MSTYKNWHTSVLAIANKIKAGLVTISPDCVVIDADGAVEMGDMPKVDWIGIGDFEWIFEEYVTVTFTLVVSTFDDPGLFRLRDMTDQATEMLLPKSEHVLIDPTGAVIGSFKIMSGTMVTPSREVGSRPVRLIQVRAGGGPAAGGS